MKYPSPEDIDEMRARGHDQSVIDEALALGKRWHEKERIKDRIRAAFARVRLGDGIGLREAQGLDDYASAQQCAIYRAADQKEDWTALALDEINACRSSLSFFDAAGMRFHLPAFLLADLDGVFDEHMDYCLTQSTQLEQMFALLDGPQRAAVRAYLGFIVDDPDYEFSRDQILRALDGYWAA